MVYSQLIDKQRLTSGRSPVFLHILRIWFDCPKVFPRTCKAAAWRKEPVEMKRTAICAEIASDQTGKVFRVELGKLRCMVCELMFTRQTAAEHATVECWPESNSVLNSAV
jgi:hypothetical protein